MQRMRPEIRQKIERSRASGFTLVELLTATVVMALTLLGVYTVFRQALATEQSVSARWRERAAAEAVASHLADAIERLVHLPDTPPLVAEHDGEGGRQFVFVMMGADWSADDPAGAAIQRRRYWWSQSEAVRGQLQLQIIPLAGTADVAPDPQTAELQGPQRWAAVPPEVIAEDVDEVSIEFRPRDDTRAAWSKDWKEPEEPFAARIRVRVGGQTVERLVAPPATAPLLAQEES